MTQTVFNATQFNTNQLDHSAQTYPECSPQRRLSLKDDLQDEQHYCQSYSINTSL